MEPIGDYTRISVDGASHIENIPIFLVASTVEFDAPEDPATRRALRNNEA
jgi:hypothetical protein